MNPLIKDILHGLEDRSRVRANKMQRRVLLGLSGCLIGLAGLGFLTAAAFLALSTVAGPAWSALITGVVLLILAGGFLALVCKPLPNSIPADVQETDTPPAGADPANTGVMIAFTAAFVLARYLNGDGQS